ncbi:MAG: tRNA (N(6)-L-threonylcarbamoyladenosine(37)-C(2))-methylthiotransferase MtaB [Elusimicrobia bacterium]|nr:tRNA (N(6)-L-threonylcarbamoyladenosine(37)-C(2))-methylthiotransferase MtaB [Candidatus Liberimonas magnetica]
MKKLYLHTFGCKVNQYDSQVFMEALQQVGYALSKSMIEADLFLINSCTVTSEADRQCRQLIRKVLKDNKLARVIVAGCYPARCENEIRDISDRIEVLPQGMDIVMYLGHKTLKNTNIGITKFDGHSRAFVKVQDGCNAFCTYCIVPYIRSKIFSKPLDDVLSEIKKLVDSGYPEIVLTGVRLGLYEGGLVNLLKSIVYGVNGRFRIRLSSLGVNHIDNRLLEFMSSNKSIICPHLHIPLQSGSEHILKLMKRQYSAKDFESVAETIYKYLPDASISTDVIAGFPGENEKDFKDTFEFVEKLELSRLHVFRYSKRPGTRAAGFEKQLSPVTIKERVVELKKLDACLQERFWRKFIGKCRPAVDEAGNNCVLTDNYIRLYFDKSNGFKENNKIFGVKVIDLRGEAWGIANSTEMQKLTARI